MARSWKDVKAAIEADIDRIWWDEPEEVKMSRGYQFPSGAGTDGRVIGNMFFLVCDTQAMGWWTAEPTMRALLNDPTFTLEHCKRSWRYMNLHMAKLMGDVDPPRCPAPWLNLPTLSRFAGEIVESFDSIEEKSELEDLNWSWMNYVNRINRWFVLIFPWELGDSLPRVESKPYLLEKA